MVSEVQDVIATALGAEPITTTGGRPGTLYGRHPLSARPALRPAIHCFPVRDGVASVALMPHIAAPLPGLARISR